MLRFGARRVDGFALGGADAFAHAQTDLQHQVIDVAGAGDAYYGADLNGFSLDFSDAVASYQAAGQAGATSVGPEIDAAGAPNATQPFTSQAWTLNGVLASLPRSGAAGGGMTAPYFTQADADKARTTVRSMIVLYQGAISAGAAAAPASSTAPTGSTSSVPISSGSTRAWAIAGVTTGLAALTIAFTRRRMAHG